jgi:hypothetical protein
MAVGWFSFSFLVAFCPSFFGITFHFAGLFYNIFHKIVNSVLGNGDWGIGIGIEALSRLPCPIKTPLTGAGICACPSTSADIIIREIIII